MSDGHHDGSSEDSGLIQRPPPLSPTSRDSLTTITSTNTNTTSTASKIGPTSASSSAVKRRGNNPHSSPPLFPPPSTPPQPLYILRGHSAQINAVHFFRKNSRLLTSDAEGWVVMWKVSSRRPVAVWRAHEAAVLGVREWGPGRIITHGRDNKLYVWKLGLAEEKDMSTVLPVEVTVTAGIDGSTGAMETGTGTGIGMGMWARTGGDQHRKPWLLHSLDTNALNFCSFAMCPERPGGGAATAARETGEGEPEPEPIIIAAPSPSIESDSIDIIQLPTGKRIYSSINICTASPLINPVISSAPQIKSGMAMSLSLFHHPSTNDLLCLAVGYESGHVCIFGKKHTAISPTSQPHDTSPWETLYIHRTHTQPVLGISLLLSPSPKQLLSHNSPSSSPFPTTPPSTAYVLSSSADPLIAKHPIPNPALDSQQGTHLPIEPVQTTNTHHTGQQSLTVRSDGKLFATAGWDGKARVYETVKLREVAVLKWHVNGPGQRREEKEVGCYAVGLGEVLDVDYSGGGRDESGDGVEEGSGGEKGLVKVEKGMGMRAEMGMRMGMGMGGRRTVEQAREEREMGRHWVTAGGRDGRVSLWEIF